jgi:putative Holliday junction resolvase
MRVLGIDYGSARVGLALGDTDARIASAWEVLENDGTDVLLEKIKDILKRETAEKVVVGIPRPLSDASAMNDQVRDILAFVERLRATGVDIETFDESLTSRIASQQARESGRRGSQDDLAAAAMLQGWLDKQLKNA